MLHERNIDICCFSETFLKDEEVEILQLENFKNVSHFCRKFRKGGGVAIYTKKSIECRDLEWVAKMSVESHFECCGATVSELNCLIICIYRTPNSNLDIFLVNLELLLIKLVARPRNSYKNIFVLGDFNVNILENNKKVNCF